MANIYNEPESTNVKITLKNNVYSYLNTEIGKAKICLITDQGKFGYSDLYGNLKKCLTDASGSSVTPENCVFIADSEGSASHSTTFVYNDNKLGVNIAAPQSKAHFHEPTTASCLIQITNSTTGSSDEYDGMTIGFSGGDNVIRTTYMRPVKIQSEDTLTPGTFRDIATFIDDGGPNREVILDADGYIKNKLMVGSLTETPENQLSVFKDADESVFLTVGNSNTGQNGVRIGLDRILENSILTEHVVFDMQYTTRAISFRSEGPVAGVYSSLMSLYYGPDSSTLLDIDGNLQVAGSSSLVNVEAEDVSVNNLEVDDTFTAKLIKADWYSGHLPLYIKNATDAVYAKFETIEDVKTVTVADNLVVDGNLQVGNDITLLGNFDADDKITASAISAKYLGSATYGLYIKSDTGNIAAFWEYEGSKSLTVFGDLVVDGLTASQIVETDANKKLISVAKGTAYNANFGTGSNDVCRGDDSRLSDARTPINNDYYVQGSSSTRTTDAGDTDVDSYSQSGFYGAASTALNLPTATGYGIIHTNHTTNQRAFQLASRWSSNNLYYRKDTFPSFRCRSADVHVDA